MERSACACLIKKLAVKRDSVRSEANYAWSRPNYMQAAACLDSAIQKLLGDQHLNTMVSMYDVMSREIDVYEYAFGFWDELRLAGYVDSRKRDESTVLVWLTVRGSSAVRDWGLVRS
jgi:hypothetical protein